MRTQIDNLVAAIGRLGGSESLESALRAAEFELAELADQFQRASRAAPPPLTLPKFFRGDAAFANPALYRLLEKEGYVSSQK